MRAVVAVLAVVVILSGCGETASDRGEQIARELGCVSCHGAADGVGPSWSGKPRSARLLVDGSTVPFDEAYVRRSIRTPGVEVVSGFDPVMPAFSLTQEDENALVTYILEVAGS